MDLRHPRQFKAIYEQSDVDLFKSGQNKSLSGSSDALSGPLLKIRNHLKITPPDQTYCF